MKFVKVNKNTLRCLITEDEMDGFGIRLDELLSNREKAQDFLQMVLADAEEQTGFRLDESTLSVEATMLPGQGISLTISEKKYSNSVADKIKRFHDAVLDYARLQDDDEENIKDLEQPQKEPIRPKAKMKKDLLLLRISDLDRVLRLCQEIQVPGIKSSFYKMEAEDSYYLILEKQFTDDEFRHIGGTALEFSDQMLRNEGIKSYVQEHGTCLMNEHALELLGVL